MNIQKKQLFITLFFSWSFFSCFVKPTYAQEQDASAYSLSKEIAKEYLRSFSDAPKKNEEDKVIKTKVKKAAEKRKALRNIKVPKLREYSKRNIVFNKILPESKLFNPINQKKNNIFNEYACGDLKLFFGSIESPTHHLVQRINRTRTLVGESILTIMLGNPIKDIPSLKKRQHIIQATIDHPEHIKEVHTHLKQYHDVEQNILSLWDNRDPIYSEIYVEQMKSLFYTKNKKMNKSTFMMEFLKRWNRDFMGIVFNFTSQYIITGATHLIFYRKKNWKELYKLITPYYNLFFLNREFKKAEKTPPMFLKMTLLATSLASTWQAYRGVMNYLDYSKALRYQALRLADLQTMLFSAKKIIQAIHTSPALYDAYASYLTPLHDLLAQSSDTEFGKMINYLQKMPLRSWSYFFNNAGKLLVSYQLFLEHKNELADCFYALGHIDALSSIATLMQEAKAAQPQKGYVFTQFLGRTQRSKPYIQLQGMWNPFLDAEEAVSNDIILDAENGMRTMVLTGPNAGGKSTFLTGVTTALLLSQTFGIAPCQAGTITPFDKINTYINVADDIAAGKSLFMAEVDRAQKQLKILKALKQHEFSFSIMDELFSGTNPKEGEAAAYSIMEYMGKYDNALNIMATHFPRVMLLEKNAPQLGFKNYKVYIKRHTSMSNFQYTYKIIPGRSTQAIAIDILEKEGYDMSMLKRARDILAHPEKYPASFK